jgi:hypothetical protein
MYFSVSLKVKGIKEKVFGRGNTQYISQKKTLSICSDAELKYLSNGLFNNAI